MSIHTSTARLLAPDRLHDHWRRRLEQAGYEAGRIERQYQAVEPENRRVARTLESRWENALREEQKLREDYNRFLAETPSVLSKEDVAKITSPISFSLRVDMS